jgi:hypothetical protein
MMILEQGGLNTMTNDSNRLDGLKKIIESCTDKELKELYSMLYGSILYSQYVSEVDPIIHKRAVEYVSDTHGINGVQFHLKQGDG